ncbi:uncharacterized protein LOC125790067 [Astyanax mexicanus]|uniref:uncharacterized protein LOC125790067 n=1 Tax=Astyanax mexicanus TaxID=7994 RepID=UPI0020CB0899|nr:uncharacterized protein LOC125790067 [Astyanax mexicanus]
MFGQPPNLPIDILLGTPVEDFSGTREDWILEHQNRLQGAFQQARVQLQHAAALRKKYHGAPTPDSSLQIGQLVYRRNHNFQGRHKIQDLWMTIPFRVLSRPDANKAVYTVAPIDGSSAPKNIHRTELRPCSSELEFEDVNARARHDPMVEDCEISSEDETEPLWVRREVRTASSDRSLMESRTVDNEELGMGSSSSEGSEDAPVDLLDGHDSESSDMGEARSQSEEINRVTSQEPVRRSCRHTAGKHTNPFHLPRSVKGNMGENEAHLGVHVSVVCLTILKDVLSAVVTSLGQVEETL